MDFLDDRILRHASSFESSIGVQMIGGTNPADREISSILPRSAVGYRLGATLGRAGLVTRLAHTIQPFSGGREGAQRPTRPAVCNGG